MALRKEQRKSSRYRDIAAELQKEIRLGTYAIGKLLPTKVRARADFLAREPK